MTVTILGCVAAGAAQTDVQGQAEAWRAEHRLADVHQHIGSTEAHLRRAVSIMDRVGLGLWDGDVVEVFIKVSKTVHVPERFGWLNFD